MALTHKPGPIKTVTVPDDWPLTFPREEDRGKWWLDTRRVLLRLGEILEKVANDVANALTSANSDNDARFAELQARLDALEVTSQTGLIRDPQVAPDARIQELKIKLNFPTHDPKNDPTEDQKNALDAADSPSASNPFLTLSMLTMGSGGSIPAGFIAPYAGDISSLLPTGWLDCDGASLERALYPALFAAIGVTYGAADGTHFNLPDLRGRTVIGVGTGAGLTARALAAQVGTETHTLVQTELPDPIQLTVTTNNWDNGGTTGGPHRILADTEYGAPTYEDITADYTNAGGDQPHQNMQPSLALSWLIKI